MRVLVCGRSRFASFRGDGPLNIAPCVLSGPDPLFNVFRHLLQVGSRPSALILHNPRRTEPFTTDRGAGGEE